MTAPATTRWQPVHRGWVPVYALFLLLTFVASVVLYGFSRDTDRWFAWTVLPPVSAAFLGGGYAAGFVLVAGTARERTWAAARAGVVTIFVFAVATLGATLAHLDRFHFGRTGAAGFAAWLWLAVYVVVPVAMAVMFLVQRRVPGDDPPVTRPLPGGLSVLLAVQALVLVATGVALLAVPARIAGHWPWAVTPLTGRAVGAWCLPLGVAAALALRERDVRRLRAAALAYVVLGVLHLVAVLRFRLDVRFGEPATWAYLAVLVSMVAAGGWGLVLASRPEPR